jgi:DNA (cytosine-5)-methyltransferase 1
MTSIDAVDLFAGGGGFSTGVVEATQSLSKRVKLVAINHDRKALATHEANYPWATHLLTEVQSVKPAEAVPEGRLDILVASPECIYHSRALGGAPKNDQSRSSAWYLERWVKDLDVESFLVENVPEFVNWGPLDSNFMPIEEKKGTTFRFWLYTLRRHGYNVDYRVLNSADYGDATSRKRLFVMGRKGDSPITWPGPKYSKSGTNGMRKWRAAREIIDWTIKGSSIFNRKKPLSPNTVRRIIAGLKKFSGPELRPFIVLLEHANLDPKTSVRDIEEPLPVITGARGGAIAVAKPFLLPVEGFYGGNTAKDLDVPLGTVTQRGYGGIVEPFILSQASGGAPRSLDDPIPTVPTGGAHALVEPFVITNDHQLTNRTVPRSVGDPLPTIVGSKERIALIESFIYQANRNTSVQDPLNTFGTSNMFALVEPFLISYYGKGGVSKVSEPVPTISTKDRFALVQPTITVDGVKYRLEVLYRMLKPHELAAAMGFPEDYVFVGNRTQVVKQIGNAVPINIARELALSLLESKRSRENLMEVVS